MYFSAQLIAYFATFSLLSFDFKTDKKEALLLGLTSVFINYIFFVLPIAERVYGFVDARPIARVIIIDILVLFCGTVLALDLINSTKIISVQCVKTTDPQPFLIASLLGFMFWSVKSALPNGFQTYTNFVGNAAAPASLFSLGVILASNSLVNVGRATWVVIGVKIALVPILVYQFTQGVGVSPSWSKHFINGRWPLWRNAIFHSASILHTDTKNSQGYFDLNVIIAGLYYLSNQLKLKVHSH